MRLDEEERDMVRDELEDIALRAENLASLYGSDEWGPAVNLVIEAADRLQEALEAFDHAQG